MATESLTWRNPRLAGRIPELDGLRGLAILLVLVLHFVVPAIQVVPGSWQSYAMIPFQLAWSGVDLFFVLSGFLIGGILYDAKTSDSYYRTFYMRRIHRILPLYFIWIALFIVSLHFVGPSSAASLQAVFNRDLPVWSYPLFLQNLFMAAHHEFGPVWMGITWSLAIEEQFYLVLPVLVRNLSYRGITWLAVISILSAPVIRLLLWLGGSHHIARYVLLPSRADALGFGLLAALACRNETAWKWLTAHRKLLYVILLVLGSGVAFLAVHQRGVYLVGFSLLAAFYASLLLLVVVRPSRIEAVSFGSRPLMKLGTVSYAVYILHQGINALLHSAILGEGPTNVWSSLGVTLLSLTAVMLLAALSWRVLESPLIRHAHSEYRYLTNRAQPFGGISRR